LIFAVSRVIKTTANIWFLNSKSKVTNHISQSEKTAFDRSQEVQASVMSWCLKHTTL